MAGAYFLCTARLTIPFTAGKQPTGHTVVCGIIGRLPAAEPLHTAASAYHPGMPAKSFYIIDGHAHIYRAYFAPFRDLTSPTGEPVKATYVFTQMLLNLVDQRRPDYLAMVIDSGDETVFRKQLDPTYKANREPPPDDFHPQEQRIIQIVKDAGVPIFVKPGFEADDLIATMARKLAADGFDVRLVSKDKDLRQILDERTKMYDPQTDADFGPEELEKKLGFRPEHAVDVQALMGDAIDNVKGIPGVGEKTAAMLISQYGSIEGLYEHLDAIKSKKKLVENLTADDTMDRLKLNRQLVRLRDDVPFDWSAEACAFAGFNTDRLAEHLRDLGFNSLLDRINAPAAGVRRHAATQQAGNAQQPAKYQPLAGGLFDQPADNTATQAAATGVDPAADPAAEVQAATSTSADSAACDYRLADTAESLAELVAELKAAGRFAFDTETDALRAVDARLVGLSFATRPGCGWYVPVRGPLGSRHLPAEAVLAELKPLLEDPKLAKVGHNLKYDMQVMRTAGVKLRGITTDTMLAAFVLDASRMQYGIDRLALDLLNFRKIPTADLIGKGKNQLTMDRVDLAQITRYAAEDADIALRLADALEPKLAEYPSLAKLNAELEVPLIDVLAEMEFNGVAVDPAVLTEQSRVLGERIETLRGEIFKAAGIEFNPDSPKQLAEVLFTTLKLPTQKRTKTGYSTDIEVLEKLAAEHAVPRLILEYRSLVKLKGTYLDALGNEISQKTGRIHTSFNQTGASTGRLSSSDPNLQNIPIRTDEGRRIRLAFVPGRPAEQVLLTADYSQVELRVLAHFTEEPALVKAFAEDQDIHAAVAAEVFGVPPADVTREMRGKAKTINFGIIYGVTPFGLARRIEGLSVSAAKDLIDSYNRRFPGIRAFLEACVQQATEHGYVETIMGRRRPVREIDSRIQSVRGQAERVAINSVVQGSAADLIKQAMLDVYRKLIETNSPSRLLLQVHDELVFETPAAAAEAEAAWIVQTMQQAMQLNVPLKVEAGWGPNWAEGK